MPPHSVYFTILQAWLHHRAWTGGSYSGLVPEEKGREREGGRERKREGDWEMDGKAGGGGGVRKNK